MEMLDFICRPMLFFFFFFPTLDMAFFLNGKSFIGKRCQNKVWNASVHSCNHLKLIILKKTDWVLLQTSVSVVSLESSWAILSSFLTSPVWTLFLNGFLWTPENFSSLRICMNFHIFGWFLLIKWDHLI